MRKLINWLADKTSRWIATDISIAVHLIAIGTCTWYLLKITDPGTRFALAITWLISVEATLQNILQQRSINNTHDDVTNVHEHIDPNKETPV